MGLNQDCDIRILSHLLLLSLAAYPAVSARFGMGQGPILLDEIGCTGNESTLHFCTHPRVGVHDCEHDDDAGVICIPGRFNINSYAPHPVSISVRSC